MNYSTTNSSGTSSVAPGVGHFLLFPSPHGRRFVAFCALLKLIPTYIPGWCGSGFTLTGALTQLEVPFINTSEATKKSSDPTENGKSTYVTNRRISKSCRLVNPISHHSPRSTLTTLSCSAICIIFLLFQRIFREFKASSLHFFAMSILPICV